MSLPPSRRNELLQRYSMPAPRYTSYPTAAQFDPLFGAAEYQAAVKRRKGGALSLYVHIPFCASPCFYCGCTRIITHQHSMVESYLGHLQKEIEMQSKLFGQRQPIEQLHFGGGTPTYLDPEDLAGLMQCLRRSFPLSDKPDREFSIEIDPRTVGPERIGELARLGFNRLSLGVQDFDPAVQEAVNRVQAPGATLNLIDVARQSGFSSVSVDLIYGLPLQTAATFSTTLDQVIRARPDRVAAYGYAHMPHLFPAQKQIKLVDLPNTASRLELLELTAAKLTDAGYTRIGMDHFAMSNDALAKAADTGQLHRNFQGYSTHADIDLLGLGMSAISKIADVYSQNARALGTYERMLDAGYFPVTQGLRLNEEDVIRKEIIESIMCSNGVAFDWIEKRHGLSFKDHFSASLNQLQPMVDDGLVQLSDSELTINPAGHFLVRNVAAAFDEYLALKDVAKPRHSAAI